MSRIGKKPVAIPQGCKVKLDGRTLRVEGPKGKLAWDCHPAVTVQVDAAQVTCDREGADALSRAVHGTTRQLIFNMVEGVTKGFEKQLEIVGVGYNAKVEKKELVLMVGFSLPVRLPIPEGIEVATPKPVNIIVKGIDKQKVGQFAANVRGVRPPEPYKGKGIRYDKEVVRRKAAKSSFAGS